MQARWHHWKIYGVGKALGGSIQSSRLSSIIFSTLLPPSKSANCTPMPHGFKVYILLRSGLWKIIEEKNLIKHNEIYLTPHLQLDFYFKPDFRLQHDAYSVQFLLPEIFVSCYQHLADSWKCAKTEISKCTANSPGRVKNTYSTR